MSGKSYTERARALRPYIEQASESLPDSDAAKAVEMFPRWADHIGETVKPGDRRSDTDESGVLHVYRVNKGQGHTTQENWPPHSTPAMWTIINVDHAGTQDDPIPVFITKTPKTLSYTCASAPARPPAGRSSCSICHTSW